MVTNTRTLSGYLRNKHSIIFTFDNHMKLPVGGVVGADLHVISTSELKSKLLQYNIPIPDVVIVKLSAKKKNVRARLISSSLADLRNNSSIRVDVTDYMAKVMLRPTQQQPKLVITLKLSGGAYLPARFLINKGCVTPFLVIESTAQDYSNLVTEMQEPFIPPKPAADRPWVGDNTRRTKRRAKSWPTPLLYRDVTELEKVNYHCRRQDLWINFHEIGWDFVITPKDVNIGDCGGQCLDADNNIAHAVVKQILQNMQPGRNAGILCCQGANYKEISALYFKSKHEIVIGSMPKIIVKECRCR